MLKYVSYDIVFQEVPGEVTLALNLSGCPNRCEGCHSPHLREDAGRPLDRAEIDLLVERYGRQVTCLCFMGGDGDPAEVARLARHVRRISRLKTAWYSGRTPLPAEFDTAAMDYIKLGPYIPSRGGLDSPQTNQRMYRIVRDGNDAPALEDITARFRRNPPGA